MIKSFEINNFRCFHSTKAKGLSRINLFGGKNNAGKTSLLEALLLMGGPSNQSIIQLINFRGIDVEFMKAMPRKSWDDFFFQQKKEKDISFIFCTENQPINKVIINCDESVDDFITMLPKDSEGTDKNVYAYANSLMNKEAVKSALHLISYTIDNQMQKSVFVSSSEGIVGRGLAINKLVSIHLIPARVRISSEKLASEFDKAKYSGNSDASLLVAFKIVDNTIEKVETLTIGKPALYIKRKDENYMLLSLFGDAMNKIAEFILQIVNNKNGILLIDEIENGIHYENQEEIWKLLFDLCIEFNVQIFATSHSAEMIEAFKNVIKENNYQEEGSYFEMARHIKSDEIVIQKIPIDSLEDKIINQEAIRGEQTNQRRRIIS